MTNIQNAANVAARLVWPLLALTAKALGQMFADDSLHKRQRALP